MVVVLKRVSVIMIGLGGCGDIGGIKKDNGCGNRASGGVVMVLVLKRVMVMMIVLRDGGDGGGIIG